MDVLNTPHTTDTASANLQKLTELNRVAKSIFLANPSNSKTDTMDITSKEVIDFLKSLDKHKVKYLLVGGFATTFHGYIRTTHDLDLWIKDDAENTDNLIQALKEVEVQGAELLKGMPLVAGFTELRIGNSGFVADLMHSLKKFPQMDFEDCYDRKKTGHWEGVPIHVIHLNDLIDEKKATDRHKDRDDVANLKRINKL